jgi:hypothetical protein
MTTTATQLTLDQARDLMIHMISSSTHDGSPEFLAAAGQALCDIRVRDSVVWHLINGDQDMWIDVASLTMKASSGATDEVRGHCLAVSAIALALLDCEANATSMAEVSAGLGNNLGRIAFLASMTGSIKESILGALSPLTWNEARYNRN